MKWVILFGCTSQCSIIANVTVDEVPPHQHLPSTAIQALRQLLVGFIKIEHYETICINTSQIARANSAAVQ